MINHTKDSPSRGIVSTLSQRRVSWGKMLVRYIHVDFEEQRGGAGFSILFPTYVDLMYNNKKNLSHQLLPTCTANCKKLFLTDILVQ